ncbi:MAG: ABC transporter ATP-binding protein [Candidatus Methanoperedens sp.]|jgi:ABC-type multidrug transport system ATPase subunit|nr:ABC transporter ATP-binding protein [Candidatus Methanoperedens sp.]PKL53531.1 MAG: hypothetical protein CVV36_06575 [Candidatus Methanoperedenaceae archaeon HGW-Methanoperedenaceae-1]
MIVIKNLDKRFGKIHALRNLNLKVKKGTVHGLIGPEASGKSTVLRILATLMRPDSGAVTINGVPLKKGWEIRKLIGYVPKTPHFPPDSTARELVTLAASLHGIRDKSIIYHIIRQRGLESVADQSINRYSESMKKNVAIAMALVHNPPVLLIDDLTTGLDPVSLGSLKKLLSSTNKTVLITEKDFNNIEGICDSVTVLRNGSTIVNDELASIRQKVGKIALELKLYDVRQIQKLIFELEKESVKVTASGDSVFINFNSEAEIPNIIRVAANAADIKEAKSMKITIDEVFGTFNQEGIR